MKKIVLIIISIIVIILGIFAFIPKDSFVQPNFTNTQDNLLYIMDIDKYILEIDNNEILYSRNWQANNEILGSLVSNYMNENNISEIGIRTNMTKNSVEFVCFADNVNTQKFYYNDEGNLIAYISKAKNNIDKTTHYFNGTKQINMNIEYENKNEYLIEDEASILDRANNIYKEYIVEEECKISIQNLSEVIVNEEGILIGNINFEYPILSKKEQNKVIDKINKKIKQETEKRYNDSVRTLQNIGKNIHVEEVFVEQINESGETIMVPQEPIIPEVNYYIKEYYEQKYLDYKTLSYIIKIEKYIGETVEIERIVKNYDLLTGKELELLDIHNLNQKEFNNKLINKFQYKYDRYLLNDTVLNRNINKIKFYLTEDYVVFYFDKGIVSNNIPEIQIKYIELK